MNEKLYRQQELDRLWLLYLQATELDDPVRQNQVVRDMILHCNRLLVPVFDFMSSKSDGNGPNARLSAGPAHPLDNPVASQQDSLPVFTPATEIAHSTQMLSAPNEATVTEAKQKQNLEQKVEQNPVHNKLYSCKLCGESFAKIQQLNAHQIKHRNR